MNKIFKLHSEYAPTGDQPQAIETLVKGFQEGNQFQTLLGVTGSGKTFTMANVIAQLNKPTLVIAHNKTLAAQLYGEFKSIFRVTQWIFFSIMTTTSPTFPPRTPTLKRTPPSTMRSNRPQQDAAIIINRMKHHLCIHGLGSPIDYQEMVISLRPGMEKDRDDVIRKLIDIQYDRNDMDFKRGSFRVKGDVLDIYPAYSDGQAFRVEFFGDEVDRIMEIDTVTGEVKAQLGRGDFSGISLCGSQGKDDGGHGTYFRGIKGACIIF